MIDTSASKERLVARLKETFQFCDQVLASLDDSALAEQVPLGGKPRTRAAIMTLTTSAWGIYYGHLSNYLRLNNLVPPSSKKPL